MIKKSFNKLDLDLYEETIDNGLSIYIVPKKNVNNIYATFTTRYGNMQNEFIPLGKDEYIRVPMGVAHFLEHKVFENADGTDPFSFYTERGADANANTSNYRTTYLFSGTKNFKDNLEYLLDFVQNPYFTDQNVEKEKGIIEQEINLYADIPYWKLYNRIIFNSFVYNPIKYPIEGTKESISNITKEILYDAYNTFYHPSNMFLIVVGNVDPNQVINIVSNNQSKKSFLKASPIKIKAIEEPNNVLKEFDEIEADVVIPKAAISYKFNIKDFDFEKIYQYLNLYFNIKLGATSLLNEQLRKDGLISNTIDYDCVYTDSHILYFINVESYKLEETLNRIKEEIVNTKVLETEFLRKKKVLKSASVFRSDNIFSISSKINRDLIQYGEVKIDDIGFINSLNYDEFKNTINKLDFTNIATVILQSNLHYSK